VGTRAIQETDRLGRPTGDLRRRRSGGQAERASDASTTSMSAAAAAWYKNLLR
jgi:hypothetical protein